jgi:Dullard-like phosphatase family protein
MTIHQVISAIACVVFEAIRFIIIQLVAVVGWLALMKVLLAMVWVLLKSLVSTIHAMLLFMKQNEQPQSAAAAAFPIVFRDNDASGYKSSIASPAPPTPGTTDWPRRTTKTNDQAAPGNTPELQPTRPNKSYTSPPDSASMIASLATAISCCDRKSSAYFSEVEAVVPTLQQETPQQQHVVPEKAHQKWLVASNISTDSSSVLGKKRSRPCCRDGANEEASPRPRKYRTSRIEGQGAPVVEQVFPKQSATEASFRTTGSRLVEAKSRKKSNKGRSSSSYPSDLIVVLDLDECLVHAEFLFDEPLQASFYTHQVQNTSLFAPKLSSVTTATTTESVESFRVRLGPTGSARVNLRPGVLDFLKEITSMYETHIYTAATSGYADAVLNQLCSLLGHSRNDDDNNDDDLFAGRWYRQDCVYDVVRHAYVKDLTRLPIPLHRTVLVDNNPFSFLAQPRNGILVNDFFDDGADRTLCTVARFIATQLVPAADVRHVLACGPCPMETFAPAKKRFPHK